MTLPSWRHGWTRSGPATASAHRSLGKLSRSSRRAGRTCRRSRPPSMRPSTMARPVRRERPVCRRGRVLSWIVGEVVVGVNLGEWKRWAGRLKSETYALYLAYKDPRVPLHAKLFAALVVGYAFSPIDLIPDPIPVLGYLDDLVLIPLGIALSIRMIPEPVLAECREKARRLPAGSRPVKRVAAGAVVAVWLPPGGVALFLSGPVLLGAHRGWG